MRDLRVDLVMTVEGALGGLVDVIEGSSEDLIVDYMPSISFPARVQEDGEVIEHFPFRNIVACSTHLWPVLAGKNVYREWPRQ